jgi:hypothetical protein
LNAASTRLGIYYDPNQAAIVPDGFLAVGVKRDVGERGRLSYVLNVKKWKDWQHTCDRLALIPIKFDGEG